MACYSNNIMKQALLQIHKRLEQLQKELDDVSSNQMGKVNTLESRIAELMTARNILEKEYAFEDRGSCQECGQLGNGKSNGFISCGLHEVITI